MTARPDLLILSFSHIPSDPRVLKQVEVFKDDYRVSTCGYGAGPKGVHRHYALPADSRGWASDRFGLMTRRFAAVYRGLSAVKAARAELAGARFDVVLANDLNTLPVALELDPRQGVHADLHEFAPKEKFEDLKWRIFVAPYQRWLCRRYLTKVKSVTTVSEGIAKQYEADYGVPAGVVTNAAPYVSALPRAVGREIRLIHSAAGQRYRKLENFIEAMKDAPEWLKLDLIVMPNEPDYIAELQQMATNVPAVRFREPVPYSQLVATLAEYDVSIVFLPPTNFNLQHALPNKFFEAVQARLGVIVGPSPAMAAITQRYGFGVVTSDFSADTLRKTLQSLTPEVITSWKMAAHDAAIDLSAESQVKIWRGAVSKLAMGSGGSA